MTKKQKTYKTFPFVGIYLGMWIGLRNLLHHVSYSRPQLHRFCETACLNIYRGTYRRRIAV